MCGIFAMIGDGNVVPRLVDGLKALEYRGYDSAGIAVVAPEGLSVRRRVGRVRMLADRLRTDPCAGPIGIAHTRWATHGRVSDANAHPHATDRVALVHNGIVENHASLREELTEEGRQFASETDTECILHLVGRELEAGRPPVEAVRQALHRLRGAYALVALFREAPDLLVAARNGAPVCVALQGGEAFVASDPLAIASHARAVRHLRDGDVACVARDRVEIFGADGRPGRGVPVPVHASEGPPELGGHPCHMAREIHEQPAALSRLVAEAVTPSRDGLRPCPLPAADLEAGVELVACGTGHFAGMLGEMWIEELAKIRARADIASEFRYRPLLPRERALSIFLSQSGETADTLAAHGLCKAAGRRTAAIVNARGSALDREADRSCDVMAGREVSVASTKAFTCTLAALLRMAWSIGAELGRVDAGRTAEIANALSALPAQTSEALAAEDSIRAAAARIADAPLALYLGRGPLHVIALEGALKLKEISYIHAEGFPAGELKHGPIALVDERVPVIALAPRDSRFDKTVANLTEAAARGARTILVSDREGIAAAGAACEAVIEVPSCPEWTAPIVYAPVVQLLAYHAAVALGRDVDRPRNLAKSVTVE